MVENSLKIRDRVKNEGLVTNLSSEEILKPNGYGFNLRAGAIYEAAQPKAEFGDEGLTWSKNQGNELKRFFDDGEGRSGLILRPQGYYLVETYEEVRAVPDLMPVVYSKSGLARFGLELLTSEIPSDHVGHLTLGLKNLNDFPLTFWMGTKICQLVFYEVKGEE